MLRTPAYMNFPGARDACSVCRHLTGRDMTTGLQRWAMLALLGLLTAQGAFAQPAPDKAAKVADTYAKSVEIFGGQDKLQAAFEEARAEQVRVEGALQLSLNLEARLRANNAAASADIYLKAADGLKPSVEKLREVFAKLEALDTPLDEARGRAAYDRVTAEHAALFQKPLIEQFEYSKAHPLTPEPLTAIQTMAEILIAVAEK